MSAALPAETRPAEWRERAALLRRYGAEGAAAAFEECAETLEEDLRVWKEEPLTLGEAAEASGYSADHLGRLVRDGKILNAGRQGAPLIRRADLPIKVKTRAAVAEAAPPRHPSNRQVVQSIINAGVR